MNRNDQAGQHSTDTRRHQRDGTACSPRARIAAASRCRARRATTDRSGVSAHRAALRHWLPRPGRGPFLACAILTLSQSASAGLLLTEIHYNGPGAGTDPDEFLELAHQGDYELDLGGYRFSAGIDFEFAPGVSMAPRSTVVIARDAGHFAASFPTYTGPLFDFAGALSNAGETLTLVDPDGRSLWSLRYDDAAPWPDTADGAGDSLQLLATATDVASVKAWFAAAPTPGAWPGLAAGEPQDPPVSVPAPGTALLLALALPGFVSLRLAPRHC